MSAETSLYSALAADSSVGAICDDRIYPDVAPQDASLPAVAFERIETEYTHTIHSAAPVATKAVLDVFCMAETRASAEGLGDAVQAAAAAAEFLPVGRRSEFNAEQMLWATVLTVEFWE